MVVGVTPLGFQARGAARRAVDRQRKDTSGAVESARLSNSLAAGH